MRNYFVLRCLLKVLLFSVISITQLAYAHQDNPRVEDTFRIGVDDVLLISAIDVPAYANIVSTVLPDGTINIPIVGQVKAVGMTLKELEKVVTQGLAKQFVKPRVAVILRERHIRQVSILGSVKQPGKRVMKDGWRIIDAIGDAGGLSSDRLEFFKGELFRVNAVKVVQFDIKSLFQGDISQNILLDPDDVINISPLDESKTYVQVIGEVQRPGPVITPRDGSIASVLNAAGGPTKAAALSQAKLERNGTIIPIDLRKIVRDGTIPSSTQVEPGDKLIVPENKQYIQVLGVVGHPGELVYPDDRTLTVKETIAYAGGVTQGAELKRVSLTRVGQDGKTTRLVINVEKMLKTSDLSDDITVQPGDTIYVPSNPRRGMTTLEVLGILQTLAISMPFLIDRVFKRL